MPGAGPAAALAGLPGAATVVITLRDVEGYNSDEVCSILEISAANQRVLLHRARAAVRGRAGALLRRGGDGGDDVTDPHDMRCAEFVELVTDLLDGALDAETEQRVIEHLSLCDGCQTYIEQVRRTVEALGDPPAGEPPALDAGDPRRAAGRFPGKFALTV